MAGREIGSAIIGHPANAMQVMLIVVGVIVVVGLALRLTAPALQTGERGFPFRLLATGVGLAVVLAAAIAVRLYVIPRIENETARTVAFIGLTILACLLVAVPLQARLLRAPYFGVLVQFILALLLGYVTILLIDGVLSAWEGGTSQNEEIEERREQINRLLRQ